MNTKSTIVLAIILFAGAAALPGQEFTNLPGTRLYVRIPKDYRLVLYANRYVNQEGASIEAAETAGDVATTIATYLNNRDAGLADDLGYIIDLERQEKNTIFVTYQGCDGFIQAFRQVTGNGHYVSVITGIQPRPMDPRAEDDLRTAIQTAKWNKSLSISYARLLYFSMDQKDFPIAGREGNRFLLDYRGKKRDAADEVAGFVGSVPLDTPVPENYYDTAAAALCFDLPEALTDMDAWDATPITLQDLPGIRVAYRYESSSGPRDGVLYAYFRTDRVFFMKGEAKAADTAFYTAQFDTLFAGWKPKGGA